MAVRQLAGPFNIVLANGALVTDPVRMRLWYPGVGLLLEAGWDKLLVTLDGVCQVVGRTFITDTIKLCWQAEPNQILAQHDDGMEYFYDSRIWHGTGIARSEVLSGFNYNYVRLVDRRLDRSISDIVSVINGVRTVEADAEFYIDTLWAGRSNIEVFLSAWSDGEFRFYDTHTRTMSPIMNTGMSHIGMVYAPEFGVVVSLHGSSSPYQLRVWSLETVPDTLSDPEVISGELLGGRVVTYRVRAMGAHSDPCVGELIDWTLTGEGILLDAQSETDEDGYAITKVKYGLYDSGDSVVSASLLC